MRCWKSASAVLVSVSLLGTTAAQAAPCTTPVEWAALRSAAVQQELMVAGLTCQAINSYNRFVIAYRAELQSSDADLKAYFIKRNGLRGEAAYDTFKTKLANLSSLSEISNTSGFCAATRAAFDMAGRRSLAEFVADQRLMIALPEQQFCAADPAMPVLANAESMPPAPARLAAVEPPPAIQPQRGQAYDGPRGWAPPPYPRWSGPNYYGR
jgi:hypothetical protein